MSATLADALRATFEETYVPPRDDLRARVRTVVAANASSRGPKAGRFALSLAVGIATALLIALAISLPRIIGAIQQASQARPTPHVAPTGPPATGLVPWISTAAGPDPTPTPTPQPTSPAGVATCRSSDLRASVGPGGAGLSHYGVPLIFTDRGSAPCTLSGFPRSVRFLDSKGDPVTEYPVVLADGGYMTTYPNNGVELFPTLTPTAADTGQADLLLQMNDPLCGNANVTTVVVTLRDGGVFRFETEFGGVSTSDCEGPVPSPVMVSSFQPLVGIPPPAITPTPDIDVSIGVNTSAPLGGVLDYRVTLTNVSGQTIDFDPCPGYVESIKGLVVARYLLNCSVVPSLAAGESRTFAMELPLSDVERAVPGTYPLDWLIDNPYIEAITNGPAQVIVKG
jgi:hypothetical protein